MSNNVTTTKATLNAALKAKKEAANAVQKIPQGNTPERKAAVAARNAAHIAEMAALNAWQKARAAAKAKPATAAGARTRKQRSNRCRYTRKH